jgi:type IV secretion system protein VirB10
MHPVTEIGDPRLQELFGSTDPREVGVRPTVGLPSKGLPPILLAGLMLLLAVILFAVLNARRTSQAEPAVGGPLAPTSANGWEPPPQLYIPPVVAPVTPPPVEEKNPQPAVQSAPVPAPRPVPQIVYAPKPVPQPAPPPVPATPPRVSAGAPLVIDGGAAAGGSPATADNLSPTGSSVRPGTRMRASALANRSMTVPQGYLIPAVLETGFDSTKPGFARAMVSRDVRGFDGKNVLIPRGSRLIGDYHSDVAQTQKRAVIIWTRLIRPDGMTIALDSPAVDTLGRGGVAASVNTHFFQRLGDALLQTTVGIGSAIAQRRLEGPVVILPGATAAATTPVQSVAGGSGSYVPTLTVAPGKSISVFVAHDLDFSAAGAGR